MAPDPTSSNPTNTDPRSPDGPAPGVDAWLDVLCCPVTGSSLSEEADGSGERWLVSRRGRLRYPVVGGIPQLTPMAAVLPDGCSSVEDAIAAHPG